MRVGPDRWEPLFRSNHITVLINLDRPQVRFIDKETGDGVTVEVQDLDDVIDALDTYG